MSYYEDQKSGQEFREGLNKEKEATKKGVNAGKKAIKAPRNIINGVEKGKKAIAGAKVFASALKEAPKATLKKAAKDAGKAIVAKATSALIGLAVSLGIGLILFIVAALIIICIFTGFTSEDNIESMASVYETQRDNIYSLLSGQYESESGDLIDSGQALWKVAFQNAEDKAKSYINENYGDYDNQSIRVSVTPKSIDTVVDDVVTYFLAINTAIYHHSHYNDNLNESEAEEELKKEAANSIDYLQDQVSSNLLNNFFKVGSVTENVKMMQTKSGVQLTQDDIYFRSNCNGKGYKIWYQQTEANGSTTSTYARACTLKVNGTSEKYGIGEDDVNEYNGYKIGKIDKYVVDDSVLENAKVIQDASEADEDAYVFYEGDVKVNIEYDLGEYRKDDVDECIKKYAEEKNISEEDSRQIFEDEVNDILDMNKSTLSDQGAFKNDSEFERTGISGLKNITSSNGWTFPTDQTVGITAGTWSYPSGGEHRGIDLAVPNHSNLLAVGDGVILRAADGMTTGYLGNFQSASGGTAGGGNMILLLTPINGSLYAVKYCHMTQGLVVSTGQSVKAGQLLGYSGSTGNSSGPHCHIEIMYLGSADDYASYAASWDGDWTCGTGWNLGRLCSATDAPCKLRPEEIFGF